MKSQRLSPSFVQHLFRFLLPVLFLAAPFAGFAAPTITATKDDGVATGVRKVSGSTINYTNQINNTAAVGAGNDATGVTFTDPDVLHTLLTGTVKVTPIAFDDAYPNVVGNTLLTVNAASGLLANDIDPDHLPHVGTTVKVASVTHTGANLTGASGPGTLTAATDGSFTYLPGLGGTGTETFTYLVTDSDGLDSVTTGTVTFTVTGRVWYVVAGGVGDGRSPTPSGSPSAMSTAANAATDFIYVYFNAATLNGAFTLTGGVSLIGEGVALVVNAATLRPAGSTPTIQNNAGDNVTLGLGNTLAGFNMGNTSGKAITGTSVGTLSVSTVSINTTGAGLDLTGVSTPTVSVVLGGLTSTGGTKNVNLVGLNGTVTLASGALSGASGNAFDVSGGNAAITYGGTITQNTGRAVNIASRTGGTITLSGLVTSSGAGATGVNLATNTGATINFTGGLTLSTQGNDAFTATGGGTINATQNNTTIVNTLTTTTGQALKVTSTTIGASGLTFRSISSNGGTNNGVILDTTGSGNFTVTGNGGGITGGTIQNKSGADGSSSTQGCGMYLNAVGGTVALTGMDFEGCQNYGIRGLTVGGFTLATSTAGTSAVNGTSNVADAESGFTGEGSIRFTNLTGTASITGCTLDGGLSRTAAFLVTSGTMNLTVNNCTVRNTSVSGQTTDALYVGARNASVANLTVTNACQFTAYRQNAIQTDARDTSTMTVNIDGSVFANSNATLINAAGSLNLGSSASTDTFVQFNVQNNTFRHGAVGSGSAPTNGGAHLVCGTNGIGAGSAGKFDGKFLNNTVGVTGIVGSGAGNAADCLRMFASGNVAGTTRVSGTNHTRYLVQGNTIKRYGEAGVQLNARQGNGIIDATFFGNTINEPGTAALGAFAGIWVNAGAIGGDTNVVNVVIGDKNVAGNKNSLSGSDPNATDDVFIDGNGANNGLCSVNLSKNGSTSGTAAAVISDDNNGVTTTLTNGTVNLVTTLPSVPPLLLAEGGIEKAGVFGLPGTLGYENGAFTGKNAMFEAKSGSVRAADGSVRAADGSVRAADGSVRAADGPVRAADGPVRAADGPVRAADGPVRATDAPVRATDGPVRAADAPVRAADAPVRAADGPVRAADGPVRAADGSVRAADGPVSAAIGSVGPTAPAVLTQSQLDTVVSAAMARWEATGLTKEQLARLRSVTFEVADLPGWYLGEAAGSHIRVDNDAGGNGWHVDASAESDALFGTVVSPTRRYTDPASAPAGRIDLLTAVLHEFGHALGLGDSYLVQDRDSIMFGQLTKGERRLPAQGQAVGAVPSDDGVTHFLGSPVSIGVLPAGKSVQILYTVQVENPITPSTTTQTSSQATISGSNFANVSTDDTALPGGAADPTVTLLAPPPTVTINTASRAINAPTLVINGTNFSTVLADNAVVLSSGTANVTGATATQLTITFTTPPSLGVLNATVSTTFDSPPASAGSSPVTQVATIVPAPTVTLNAANRAINAPTLVINGTGFDASLPANNTVVFNNGAVGNVTAATATSLTVTFTTQPAATGSLTAIVTSFGGSSTPAKQVATIVAAPTVTLNSASLAQNAPQLIIAGTGFDATTPANNTVVLSSGTATVTAATATQLTCTLGGPPSTGSLTAVVTSFGGSSGAAVQVATIVAPPTVTANAASLAQNAPQLIITGTGFNATTPANNTVALSSGTATVTAATATQLTCTLGGPPALGSLTAIVTSFNGSSGAAVQVATIVAPPTVTLTTTNRAINAPTVIITGTGFNATTPAANAVTFNLSAVGNVTAATSTQLTVTFTTPPTLGSLTAIVNSFGGSSGAAVQVATIVAAPTVTPNTANLGQSAPTITINGTGFDAVTPSANFVTFNLSAVGNVTASTATSLTVTFTSQPSTTGNLTAVVNSNGGSSGAAVQVATVVALSITSNTANLASNAPQLIINGAGFSATPGNNSVVLSSGTATVTASTTSQLTCTLAGPPSLGVLNATVTVVASGSTGPTQVATIVAPPTVTLNASNLASNAPQLIIAGTGFNATTFANNTVVLSSGTATVTAATATQLTCTLAGPPALGSLTAIVTSNGGSSGAAVQVATIVAPPTVTLNAANRAINAPTLIIAGTGFNATTPANNTVAFSSGTGTVTAATATQLTVTFSVQPSLGSLTAIVTSFGGSSGAAVQVATIVAAPTVTANTANLAQNATQLIIAGTGFSTTAANNTVVLNSGTATVTVATATQLTCTLAGPPATGSLTAVVTSNGGSSGAAVQVATIVAAPTVTANASNLASNSPQLIIAGTGFNATTPSNNSVVLNSGTATVTAATATQLTCTLAGPPALGSLTAVVTSNGGSSGAAVQVATIVAPPTVTLNAANRAINAPTLIIAGTGFNATTPANNTVVFNNSAVGNVTAATATQLTVTFTAQPAVTGSLTAVVTSFGGSSGAAVQVANIVAAPTVTLNATNLAQNATQLIIAGTNFSTTAANNTVVLNSGTATVTISTATQLTCTLAGPPATGSLTAVVTSNGGSSGGPIQVATIVAAPTVTANTAALAQNAPTLIIAGTGFSTTAANNTVVLSSGTATVTVATATQLTCTLAGPPTLGSLTAVVTSNGGSSGAPVQVATIVAPPTVTANAADLAQNATTLIIAGTNFSTTAANNTVALSSGTATVTVATATQLTCTLAGPPTLGSLTAIVTSNGGTSGAAVQVANIVAAPTVNANTAALAQNAPTLIITGTNFSTTAANNTVALNSGTATVTAATATQLTCTLAGPPALGSLTAVVTSNGGSSGAPVQVATIVAAPTVNANTADLAQNAPTLIISGTNFSTTAANNTVALNSGTATVTVATATQLTCTLAGPPALGSLTAVVTSNGGSSGAPVQVANIVAAPTVTANTADLAQNAPTLIITGTNFSTTAANNTVALNSGTATVTVATATQLTCTLAGPPSLGSLTAIVTSNGGTSGGAVQVANIVAAPTVNANTAALSQNAPTLIITGTNFSTTAANNSVSLSSGAATVTVSTATQLTCTVTAPPTLGSLTAIVTSNGGTSGAPVQVATVVVAPTVTANTADLAQNAPTLIIAGTGFSTTAANNTVALNSGTATVTVATATQLTCTLAGPPALGSLTAVVTSNGGSSGAPVQVANIVAAPTVNANTADLAQNAQLIITGTNFSTTAANNTVALSSGTATVTVATATQLTCTLGGPPSVGSLTAIVTSNGGTSGAPVQVANIVAPPTVTVNTADLSQNAPTLIITGTNFSTTAANNSVSLSSGAVTVTVSTATQLTCTVTGPPALGSLTAIVTSNGGISGAPVQVANVVVAPTVTANTADLAQNAPTLIIAGTGFSATAANNSVVLNSGTATVTVATATQLTCTLAGPPALGSLTAVVTSNGGSSGAPVQVANIVAAPTVTVNTADLAQNAPTLIITGTNFSTTAANNTVALNSGTATVTVATATQLTCTLAGPPSLGSLTAIVTSNGGTSGAAVQVANIVAAPTVTANTTNLVQNAPTLIIAGTNFSATPANNTVVLNSGTATVTVATATQLTCTLAGPPALGSLTAVVTSNGGSSGAPVQVATIVAPVSYTVTTTGNAIVLTDIGGTTDALSVSEASGGSIQFDVAGATFIVDGGTPIVGSSGAISRIGVTQITMNAGTGADNVTIGAFASIVGLPNVTIGSAANNYTTVSFTGAFGVGATNTLTVDAVTISSTAAGVLSAGGNITLNAGADALIAGNISHSGADATLTVRAGNNIDFSSGADVTSSSGKLHVVLNSNSDASGTGAIRLQSGTVITSNGGDITLGGGANPLTTPTLGNATLPHGILLDSATLTAGAGAINLRAQGAAVGTPTYNAGIAMDGTALVQTTTGNITAVAQGGTLGTTGSYGFVMTATGGLVTTADGAINITATAGSGTGGNAAGFLAQTTGPALLASASGTIAVTGTGGTGAGTLDAGVELINNTAIRVINGGMVINGTATTGNSSGVLLSTTTSGRLISAGSGTIAVTGTGFGTGFGLQAGAGSIIGGPSATGVITINADRIDLTSGTPLLRTTTSVTLRQKTFGQFIDLGGADSGTTLGLTDTELNRVTAPTLKIGDANSGVPISISAVVSPANYRTLAIGNNLSFAATGGFTSEIGPTVADVENITVTGTLGITAGATLNTASKGGFAPTSGQVFQIITNDLADAITGTFAGLPENQTINPFLGVAINARITYLGGSGNDVVILTNTPPVAGPVSVERYATQDLKITVAQILAQTSDPDPGDTVKVVSVNTPTAAQHGTVLLSSPTGLTGTVFYTHTDLLADQFSYTVEDNHGAQSTGLIIVGIKVDNAPSLNINSLTQQPDGSVVIDFSGIPNRQYGLQYKVQLSDPVWTNVGPVTADQYGAGHAVDGPPAHASSSGFYRLVYPYVP
jgi:hypothetical protein